ncbi:MAG: efflux RND transporter periplasmic adaptor subunit [Proteobacteria bacterium]|nr:efflux RND transporter periplasmic adaptor subunit [Pseudomonadota bacterium]MBS0598853.1 efflux RND transporter periplasmic adaptor subunit [Pseudomonadota bacterium]
MTTSTNRVALVLFAIALPTIGIAVGYRWGHAQPPPAAPAAAERKPLYWYDPMVPNEHYDKPGLSSMGMKTQPKYADEASSEGSVRVDARTQQNLGVRTAVVERRALAQDLSAPATIAWDPREASVVSARVDAIVTHLHVRAPYTRVTAGQPLADVLAPQWTSALAEQAALAHAHSDEAKELQGAAAQRLHVLGLTDADLHSARGGTITLHAPSSGIVTTLDVREGQRVIAGQTLMTVNAGTGVWVEASVPQGLAGRLQAGTPATVTLDAQPGRSFPGSVEAVLPDIDPASRTQRVRIALAHVGDVLSPGQFAHVHFAPVSSEALPLVPDEALVATGTQTRVIVAGGDGRFHPVVVTTGRSAGGMTEVLSGLRGGDRIVVSGQFLIDSEASLNGGLDRFGPGTDDASKASP